MSAQTLTHKSRTGRKLGRYIERRFKDGPYQVGTDRQGRWKFRNKWGKIYGIREYPDVFVLFDLKNPSRITAICKLTKGKKIKEVHDD